MEIVKDLKWKQGIKVEELMEQFSKTGFQSIELSKAADTIVKMKKNKAKIFLTYTSNMVTSGLRGFFAQLIKLKMVDVIITTVGGIEEDIMRAKGENFQIASFNSDDISLHEQGMNRIGNLLVSNESYAKLEDEMRWMLREVYKKNKQPSTIELLKEIGLLLNPENSKNFGATKSKDFVGDEDSILYQAAINNIPIVCPSITDGAFGFHLYFLQQDHKDFQIDIIKDFGHLLTNTSFDDKKGIIALGGGVSKHFAILSTMISGGFDFGVYMTTETQYSGSISGATTDEAKSWGKLKDNASAATVIGDATIMFPLAMIKALEDLKKEGLIK